MIIKDKTWYDGIDQNCDGWNDFDADYDGFETVSYDDGLGNIFEHGGTDCDDWDGSTYHRAAFNDSSTDCMPDYDGDGYAAIENGGTDCDDWDGGTYA